MKSNKKFFTFSKAKKLVNLSVIATVFISCVSNSAEVTTFREYTTRSGSLAEMVYTPKATNFYLWAPTANMVNLNLYNSDVDRDAYKTIEMKLKKEGTWEAKVKEDLIGKFYTFRVKIADNWLEETPGINAKAVGVNGNRAAIIDMSSTNPAGWERDTRPILNSSADIILYEMHHRDISIDKSSGSKNRGKFLSLTEHGTKNSKGLSTGIDHLVELGVTHVHILPSFDYASIDETKLEENKYNWGYDPKNYNVPDGSYSTDPYTPATRIKEFKEMVMALHKAGIRVVLDVVYNHTYNTEESAFDRTVPGYFYRQKEDGTPANGSGCGNETASDREMMRKYMVESVEYWINEYHIDGFRFDLMGIHDIETMNQIRAAADKIDPTIYIYGEGWAAETPKYDNSKLAMKANTHMMPNIAAFSDEMRDALRGPFNNNHKGAFLAGIPGNEESIKFGIVGAIRHPQIDNSLVNYSKEPWASEPTQMISYVSCHDDMCLVDRIKSSTPDISKEKLIKLNKLAQTFVFTSQGVPFIYAGEEVMRDKQGVHNSYISPDEINAIDWNRKSENIDLFNYYKGLIELRKAHPAFRMGSAELVRNHLEFLHVEESNLIAFELKDNANGDSWSNIIVAFNGNNKTANISIPEGKYTYICKDGKIDLNGLGSVNGNVVTVAGNSAIILYK